MSEKGKQLYKVLVNGRSCHGGDMEWSLPKQKRDGSWRPGKWHKLDGPVAICERGLHLTTEPLEWFRIDGDTYEAEAKGIAAREADKCVASAARLLRPVPRPEWHGRVIEFVATIPRVPWFRPDGKPDPEWRVYPTRAAAGAAAGAVARDAARVAAWDAARDAGDAAGAAVWDAAGATAWVAARDAVRAVGDAAGDAARAAAWDAAWECQVNHLCSDLGIEDHHRRAVSDRWRVWQKGYGLFAEVGGVLYVYERPGGDR
jgi:hypothetical protein